MPKHTEYDHELADFTDQLLAGNTSGMSTQETELAEVVRQLQRTISSDSAPTSFKTQLAQRLDMEWDLSHQQHTRWWETPRARRMSALLAASIVLVLGAALVLSSAGSDVNTGLEGTAGGSAISVAVVVLLAVGVAGAIAFFRRDR